MKQHIQELIHASLAQLIAAQSLDWAIPAILIESTKDKQHGDYACNIALMLAKQAKQKPRDVAQLLVNHLPVSTHVMRVEIAGPGFINFFLAPQALASVVVEILTAGYAYGRSNVGAGQRILVEFVSSNPTGPLHVGHGRHAAYGAVVCNLLAAIGYIPHREYYVNDAGRQMDILAISVWLRYLEVCGENLNFPANAYKGEYIKNIAIAAEQQFGKTLCVAVTSIFNNLPADEVAGGDKELYIDAVIERVKAQLGPENYKAIFDLSLSMILADIREDLAEFGVEFDEWYSERALCASEVVARMIERMRENNLVYENEGAVWFRATELGDEKDRVLERANGQRTYFANDLAYHINKFERGFELAIDIFGSDHHGYIPRMRAGLQANGITPDKLTYLLMQFVHLYRGGVQAQMSTRSGSFVTLRELREEVGNDVARYFYVMRRCEQPVDFDLDLAKSQSNENPVYYVQYAHARICSVYRQLAEKSLLYNQAEGLDNLNLLDQPHEAQLLGTLARYPDVILSAAKNHEPHQLTNYLKELATEFHGYYNSHQFLVEDSKLRNARLALVTAVRQILANGLQLIGVSTPESM